MKINRLIILALSVVIIVSALIGATYAYLQDTEYSENTMTMGNIDIEQIELQRNEAGELVSFENDKKFIPGVYPGYTDEALPMDGDFYDDSLVSNAVDKIVTVKNTGRSSAFVRTIITFEQGALTSRDFDKYMLINRNDSNWTWTKIGSDIEMNIDGSQKTYTIYCAVYDTALAPDTTTEPSLLQVMLSKDMSDNVSQAIDPEKDGEYVIHVFTQATQTRGFSGAVEALDESFGAITATTHPWA